MTLLRPRIIWRQGNKIIHFTHTNAFGIKEVVKKEFIFTKREEISKIGEGGSVGEYALLHGKKRSATVRTTMKTHFAIMDRASFEEVMYNIKMKESDNNVEFLNKFDFLKELTYNTKAQLSYRLKETNYVLGQDVYVEGSKNSNVYFIESGQFVLTKDLYIHKDHENALVEFRRAFVEKDDKILMDVFHKETVCFFTDTLGKYYLFVNENTFILKLIEEFKFSKNKNTDYFELKISIRSKGGVFGLAE